MHRLARGSDMTKFTFKKMAQSVPELHTESAHLFFSGAPQKSKSKDRKSKDPSSPVTAMRNCPRAVSMDVRVWEYRKGQRAAAAPSPKRSSLDWHGSPDLTRIETRLVPSSPSTKQTGSLILISGPY